jgi:hypothetical protein
MPPAPDPTPSGWDWFSNPWVSGTLLAAVIILAFVAAYFAFFRG